MSNRILLIDDHLDSVELLAIVLTRHGWDTRLTDDPRKALEIARGFQPSAVCLDIGMPEMDGYTLARAMRQIPALKRCRIIAISGYPPDQPRLTKAGIDRHMLKPVSGAVLAKMLREPAARREVRPCRWPSAFTTPIPWFQAQPERP